MTDSGRWAVGAGIWLLALPLVGCDPTVAFQVDVELPEGVKATAEQVHVDAAHQEVRKGEAAPTTAPALNPLTHHSVKATDDGFTLSFRHGVAFEMAIWMTVWVDLNGNGKLDAGDAQGKLSPEPYVGKEANNPNKPASIKLAKVP